MQKSSIEWTDWTANPIRARHQSTGKKGWACVLKSPGCANCYSAVLNGFRGTGEPFTVGGASAVDLFLDEKTLEKIVCSTKSGRMFLCDMTDMFWSRVPDEWLDEIFAVMAICKKFTFQILTKRAKRLPEYFQSEAANRWARIVRDKWMSKHVAVRDGLIRDLENGRLWPLLNLHLGVSVENQKYADERIPLLLKTPAALRFLSCEPLLGLIRLTSEGLIPATGDNPDMMGYMVGPDDGKSTLYKTRGEALAKSGIGWIIVGGESGRGARPCDLAWIRSIIKQCREAEVSCFVKQLGARPLETEPDDGPEWPVPLVEGNSGFAEPILRDRKGGDPDEWPEDLRVAQFPSTEVPA